MLNIRRIDYLAELTKRLVLNKKQFKIKVWESAKGGYESIKSVTPARP